jgi:putative membrane protein
VIGWMGVDPSASPWTALLVMVAMWAAVITVAVWFLARATRTQHRPAAALESPRAILDRRFLSGEIDAPTYAHARRMLEGQSLEHSSTVRR